jgi:hypothetical protein
MKLELQAIDATASDVSGIGSLFRFYASHAGCFFLQDYDNPEIIRSVESIDDYHRRLSARSSFQNYVVHNGRVLAGKHKAYRHLVRGRPDLLSTSSRNTYKTLDAVVQSATGRVAYAITTWARPASLVRRLFTSHDIIASRVIVDDLEGPPFQHTCCLTFSPAGTHLGYAAYKVYGNNTVVVDGNEDDGQMHLCALAFSARWPDSFVSIGFESGRSNNWMLGLNGCACVLPSDTLRIHKVEFVDAECVEIGLLCGTVGFDTMYYRKMRCSASH